VSEALLVTGATGLVGGNVCRLARAAGAPVRALVREGSDASALESLGVELVRGDLLDAGTLARALEGCDRVVHAAAALGGTWSTTAAAEYERVNLGGTLAVLDAAARAGARGAAVRVCVLATTAFLDRGAGVPITESLAIAPPADGEMAYTATKRAAFEAAMERAAAGQPVVAVFPGGVYGPAPVVGRALAPTSFNAAIARAVTGELRRYPPVKLGWVTGADVARVALLALERGAPGERFLALGRQRDACTVPEFLSRACALAGVEHRVAATGSVEDDPGLLEEFGAMARTAGTRWPEPLFDAAVTHARLNDHPVGLDEGLRVTLRWMRERAPEVLTSGPTNR
jgi:dihydroflavonol-4-reductase